MSHGGRRAGAGRKPLLPWLQRLRIGVEAENRWNALAKAEGERRAVNKARAHAKREEPDFDAIEELAATEERLARFTLQQRQDAFRQRSPIGDGDHEIDEVVGDRRAWISALGGGVHAGRFCSTERPPCTRSRRS